MSEWDQVILQSMINIGALLFGWLLGTVLADLRGRRRELVTRVERLESQLNELRYELRRSRSLSYR